MPEYPEVVKKTAAKKAPAKAVAAKEAKPVVKKATTAKKLLKNNRGEPRGSFFML